MIPLPGKRPSYGGPRKKHEVLGENYVYPGLIGTFRVVIPVPRAAAPRGGLRSIVGGGRGEGCCCRFRVLFRRTNGGDIRSRGSRGRSCAAAVPRPRPSFGRGTYNGDAQQPGKNGYKNRCRTRTATNVQEKRGVEGARGDQMKSTSGMTLKASAGNSVAGPIIIVQQRTRFKLLWPGEVSGPVSPLCGGKYCVRRNVERLFRGFFIVATSCSFLRCRLVTMIYQPAHFATPFVHGTFSERACRSTLCRGEITPHHAKSGGQYDPDHAFYWVYLTPHYAKTCDPIFRSKSQHTSPQSPGARGKRRRKRTSSYCNELNENNICRYVGGKG